MSQPSLAVGILLFSDYETLDVMGPVELLGVPPSKSHFSFFFITQDGQQVRSAQGVVTVPDHSVDSCLHLDVLLVPGDTQH